MIRSLSIKKINAVFKYALSLSILMLITAVSFGNSYYYFENFDNMPSGASWIITNNKSVSTNGWTWNFKLSRDLIAHDIYQRGGQASDNFYGGVKFTNVSLTDKRLLIFGRPNNDDLLWNCWYLGDGIKFDPKANSQITQSITATPENPFGYTIIRYDTIEDASDERQGAAVYHKGYNTAWLMEDQPSKTNDEDNINNYIFFYDKCNDRDGGIVNNNLGYYYNTEYDIDFSGLFFDADGKFVGNPSFDFIKSMDDDNSAFTNSFVYGTGYSAGCSVTRPLGIKMVSDGSTVKIYVNFNPTNDINYGMSNTWVLVVNKSVNISQDLAAFIGSETPFYLSESEEAQYDNFLIRTVSSNISAWITPTNSVTNAVAQYTLTITNQMGSTNDSGIGEIIIHKPDSFTGNWILSNVSVSNCFSTNLTNNLGNFNPDANYFAVTNNSDNDLFIRFHINNASDNQIVTNGVMVIKFYLPAPSVPNINGDTFAVYADCVKHTDTGQDIIFSTSGIKYATTGRKKNSSSSSSGLTVFTYGQPQAFATMEYSPSPLTIGNSEANFRLKLSTIGVPSSPEISGLRILIPNGFTVSNNNPATNIISSKLGTSQSINNISVINIYGTNWINVNYLPSGFSGLGDFDTISFNVYGTPPDMPPGGYYTNWFWQSFVDSSGFISGTTWQLAQTNGFGFLGVSVVISNAQSLCYILPNQTGIATNYISNVYIYFISNIGPTGNNIKRVKIPIPQDYTNVINLSSSLAGNLSQVIWYSNDGSLYVDYTVSNTNIASGMSDILMFTGILSNTNVNSTATTTDSFICYADNNNSTGFQQQFMNSYYSWNMVIKPPQVLGENSLNPFLIYTSSITDVITNTIYNGSPRGVNVQMVKIELPTNYFASIVSVQNSVPNSSISIITNLDNGSFTNHNTNYIYIYYTNSLVALDSNPAAKDTVIITVADRINYNTFSNLSTTNLPINTYVFKSGDETVGNISNLTTNYTFVTNGTAFPQTNSLYIENPHVNVEYSISPNFVPATTNVMNYTYMITNLGDTGNRILGIYLPIPISVSRSISNLILSTNSGIAEFDNIQNWIVITNTNSGQAIIDGKDSLALTFDIYDTVVADMFNVPFYPSVTNDRELSVNITNTIGSAVNGYVSFTNTKPSGGVSVSPNVFFINDNNQNGNLISQSFTLIVSNTGNGSDKIKGLMINLPQPLSGLPVSFYHVTNTKYPGAGDIHFTPSSGGITNIEIVYSNTGNEILAGQCDTIQLTIDVQNLYSLPTNGQWIFYANNGYISGTTNYFALTNSNFGSCAAYGTERISVSQVNGDCLTTAPTNNFTYIIKNGTNANNMVISDVQIKIPIPPYWLTNLSYITGLANYQGSATAFLTNIGSVSNVWIHGYISGGYAPVISFNVPKDILTTGTNVDWQCTVYYTNNYGGLGTPLSNDNLTIHTIQAISPPVAYFYGYITPNSVSMNQGYGDFQLIVTNVGETGNNLYRVEITPPTTNSNVNIVVTNITGLSSLLAGNHIYYTNWVSNGYTNGYIYVDYGANGTNIKSQGYDIISFRAYDNQTTEGYGVNGNVTWGIAAANLNTANATFYNTEDPVIIGKLLTYKIANPEYTANYALTPNIVSTFLQNNYYQFNIYNTSLGLITSSNYNITNIRIAIIPPFITNGITITSSLTSNLNPVLVSTNGTNYLVISYPAGLFTPKTNDLLNIYIQDSCYYGNSNAVVGLDAMYTGISAGYYSITPKPGFTNMVSFVMSNASFYGYINSVNSQNTNIYIDYDYWDYQFIITNVGELSNNIYKLEIMPSDQNSVYTNLVFISNTIPAKINYDGTNIFVDYGVSNNFIPNGGYDIITIRGFDNLTNGNYTGTWQVLAANTELTNPVTSSLDLDDINQTATIYIDFPGYYASYYITPNNAYSVAPINNYQIFVNNSGSTGNNITNLRILLPPPFNTKGIITNVTSVLGIIATNTGIDNGTNYVELSYAANRFGQLSNDTISINICNDSGFNQTNVTIGLKARFNTSANKYADLTVAGGMNTVSFTMPAVSFYGYLDNQDTNVNMDYDYWDYHINVTNTGGLSNNLYEIQIIPPNALTNCVFISNLIPAITYQDSSGKIFINYYISNTNSIINSGYDRIIIRGYDNQTNSGYNGSWLIFATNAPMLAVDNPYTALSLNDANINQNAQLNIINPGYSAKYMINSTNLSTLVGAQNISITVTNTGGAAGAITNSISNLMVYLNSPFAASNAVLVSSALGGVILTNGSNYVVIKYTGNVFQPGTNESLTLSVNDAWTDGNTNLNMLVQANYTTSADKYKNMTIIGGGTNLVKFVMPAVKFYGYMDSGDTNIWLDNAWWDYHIIVTNTGELSNNLYKVRIDIPNGTNVYTNIVYESNLIPVNVVYSGTNIIIDYGISNRSIANGGYDRITLRGYENLTNGYYSGAWNIYGGNSIIESSNAVTASQNLGNINQGNMVYISTAGYASSYSLSPNTVSTVLPGTNYCIVLNNIGTAGNNITNVKIYLPFPLSTNGVLGSVTSTLGIISDTVGTENGTNYIELSYGTNQFKAGTNDTIGMMLMNNLSNGNTNITMNVMVEYVTSAGKFKNIAAMSGLNVVSFIMPPANFYGYVDSKDVTIYKDSTSWDYEIMVTNIGGTSNSIYKVEIIPPGTNTILTNILIISNNIPAYITNQGGIITINYDISNMSIINRGYDRIVLRGYDNQDNGGYTGNWGICAANCPAYSYTNSCDVSIIGQSTALSIVDPMYGSEYWVNTTNLSTVMPVHTVQVAINNTGSMNYNNGIGNVRIYLPYPFITNGLIFLSNTLSNTGVSIGSDSYGNYADISYASNRFGFSSNDLITLKVNDVWTVDSMDTNINVKVNYNTSCGQYIDSKVNNGTNDVSFIMPQPAFYGYVLGADTNVFMDCEYWDYHIFITNVGDTSNNIYKALIIPPATNNVITNIVFLSNRLSASVFYDSVSGMLYVNYASNNNSIVNGSYDDIVIRGYDNQTNSGFKGNWGINGANWPAYIESTGYNPTNIGTSASLNIINPGYSAKYLINSTNLSTLAGAQNISITVTNTGGAAGAITNSISNLMVYLNSPFAASNAVLVSSALGGVILTNGSNYVVIKYTGNVFQPGTNESLTLSVNDAWTDGNTNLNMLVQANYTTSADKYKNMTIIGGGTNLVKFVMPAVKFYGYMDSGDTNIWLDNAWWDYHIVVTNTGELSNNLFKVRIDIPNGTNVYTNIVYESNLIPANVVYSGTNIIIDYGISNRSIANGGYDRITLRGYENLTNGYYSGAWNIYGGNSIIESSNAVTASQNPGNINQGNIVYISPAGYSSSYSISPNIVSTVLPGTNYSIVLNNGGSAGNNITNVKIYLPYPLSTNGVLGSVTSTLGVISDTVGTENGTNYIELSYGASRFIAGTNDTIGMVLMDDWAYDNTNTAINIKVMYLTSGGKFKDITHVSGSNQVSFVMPDPKFYGYVNSNDINIGKDYNLWDYHIIITNSGDLSNNLLKVELNLPGGTNLFTNAVLVSNLIPCFSIYNGSNIIIDYSKSNRAIPNRGYDVIDIKGYNIQTNSFSGQWLIYGDNSTNDNLYKLSLNAGDINQSSVLNIIDPAYYSTYYLMTTSVSTVLRTNNVKIYIQNTSASGNTIKSLRVYLPDPFITNGITGRITNLLGIISNYTGSTNGINFVEIYYATNNFGPNTNDVISIVAGSSLNEGNTNAVITVSAQFNTSAGKYVDSTLNGGSNSISFLMPPALLYGYINSADTVVTKDNDYWDYHAIITNMGSISNNIYKLKIIPPGTNTVIYSVGFISNLIPAQITYTNGVIYIDYSVSNMSISSGNYDRITIRGYDNQSTGGYSGNWTILGANWPTYNYTNGQDCGNINQSTGLMIIDPLYSSEYNVITTNISTVLPSSEILISLNNIGSIEYTNIIQNVRIYFPYPFITNGLILESNKISNTGFIVSNDNGSNYLQIKYANNMFAIGSNDVVALKVSDNWAYDSMVTNIGLKVNYSTSADKYINANINNGTNLIYFTMPPVSFYGYIRASDTNVVMDADSWDYHIIVTNSGQLSNNIYKLEIIPPSSNFIITNVTFISNRIKASVVYDSFSGFIYVDYSLSNNYIANNAYDEIVLRGYDNQASGGYIGKWQILAANWPAYNVTNGQNPANIGQSTVLNIFDPGYSGDYYVGTTNVSTLLDANRIKLFVENNSTNNINEIRNLHIYLSYPFITNNILSGLVCRLGFVSNYVGVENGTNYLQISYGTNIFISGTNDFITMNIADNYTNGNTNSEIKVEANYNTSVNKYMNIGVKNGSDIVNFIMPNAKFIAAMDSTDTNIDVDYDYWDYHLTISNISGSNVLDQSNYIYKLYIIPPATNGIITNIVFLSNLVGASVNYSNGILILNYVGSNNSITNGGMDRITFRGYDNQVSPANAGNWLINAVNTTFGTSGANSTNTIGLSFVAPGYGSTYTVLPSSISTISTQVPFTVTVNNTGAALNYIEGFRIYLPVPFTTNGALNSISTSIGILSKNIGIDNGTNYVEILYPTNIFSPLTNDTIKFTAGNSMKSGNTNIIVNTSVLYNSSMGKYVPSSLVFGTTNSISFAMPVPQVTVDIIPEGLYTTQSAGMIKFRFINYGAGSNEPKFIYIYVNPAFTNQLSIANLKTNALESGNLNGISFLNNGIDAIYQIGYSNFAAMSTNSVYLNISNNVTNNVSLAFQFSIDNGGQTTNIVNSLIVVQPPSAELLTRQAYSPNYTNYVQININNNTSSDIPVYRVNIIPPVYFTNILNPLSLKGTVISNSGTNIIVNYPSGLVKNDVDQVSFWVADSNYMLEVTNIAWNLEADDSSGFGTIRELYPSSLKQNMIIPQPEVSNIVGHSWYYIQTGTNQLTNIFSASFSNVSPGMNIVKSNIIILPAALTNIITGSLTGSYSGSKVYQLSNLIIIEYTNQNGLVPGTTANQVQFNFINNTTSPLNTSVNIYNYNGSSLGPLINNYVINFKASEEPTVSYVIGQQTIYTIDHTATIRYRIGNGMYDTPIMQSIISFDCKRLQISNIQSLTYSNSNVTLVKYITNASNLIIDYSPVGGIPSKLSVGQGIEELTINVIYSSTNTWTNYMSNLAVFQGYYEPQQVTVPNGERALLPVILSDFGRLRGVALPVDAKATVKVYYPGTSSIATNKTGSPIGQALMANADSSGNYFIDYIPAGSYDVSFEAQNYRLDNKIANLIIPAGKEITNAVFKMKRSAFTTASTNQSAVSVDDTNTVLILPPGAIGDFFAVDIWLTNFTAVSPYMADKAKDGTIQSPADSSKVRAYMFALMGINGEQRTEQELNNDGILKLHYYTDEIAAQGWDENKLAIYYWRSMTREWIRIGGEVDKVNHVVIIKASYLHQYYTIFGDNGTELKNAPGFVSVKTDPKVFTPRSSDREFKNIKISIGFEDVHNKFNVKIYDIRGKLLRSFERSAEYKEGEVYWDGKDEEGYDVKSGVYIYRIIADSDVYNGTIIIAR